MATRLMDEKGYERHQKKFGRSGVAVAQLAERRDVAPAVVGSSPTGHPRAPKPSKFGNVKTVVDGVKLDSKREAKRFRELNLLFKAGDIDTLARQVQYRLPGGVVYVADFVYRQLIPVPSEYAGAIKIVWVVEDAKGHRTREFINKKKQMKSQHGIDVVEV